MHMNREEAPFQHGRLATRFWTTRKVAIRVHIPTIHQILQFAHGILIVADTFLLVAFQQENCRLYQARISRALIKFLILTGPRLSFFGSTSSTALPFLP